MFPEGRGSPLPNSRSLRDFLSAQKVGKTRDNSVYCVFVQILFLFCPSGNYSSTAIAVPLPSQGKAFGRTKALPYGGQVKFVIHLQMLSVGANKGAHLRRIDQIR